MQSHEQGGHGGGHGDRDDHLNKREWFEKNRGKDHDDKSSFWRGCSEKIWGDDEHEHEAKRIAMISVLCVIVVLVIVVTVVVVCCCKRKRKAAEAARRRQDVKQAVVSPQMAIHPKAYEAFGPTGVPEPVVVCVPEAPPASGEEKKDPRLTLGVWSPPPAYEEK